MKRICLLLVFGSALFTTVSSVCAETPNKVVGKPANPPSQAELAEFEAQRTAWLAANQKRAKERAALEAKVAKAQEIIDKADAAIAKIRAESHSIDPLWTELLTSLIQIQNSLKGDNTPGLKEVANRILHAKKVTQGQIQHLESEAEEIPERVFNEIESSHQVNCELQACNSLLDKLHNPQSHSPAPSTVFTQVGQATKISSQLVDKLTPKHVTDQELEELLRSTDDLVKRAEQSQMETKAVLDRSSAFLEKLAKENK